MQNTQQASSALGDNKNIFKAKKFGILGNTSINQASKGLDFKKLDQSNTHVPQIQPINYMNFSFDKKHQTNILDNQNAQNPSTQNQIERQQINSKQQSQKQLAKYQEIQQQYNLNQQEQDEALIEFKNKANKEEELLNEEQSSQRQQNRQLLEERIVSNIQQEVYEDCSQEQKSNIVQIEENKQKIYHEKLEQLTKIIRAKSQIKYKKSQSQMNHKQDRQIYYKKLNTPSQISELQTPSEDLTLKSKPKKLKKSSSLVQFYNRLENDIKNRQDKLQIKLQEKQTQEINASMETNKKHINQKSIQLAINYSHQKVYERLNQDSQQRISRQQKLEEIVDTDLSQQSKLSSKQLSSMVVRLYKPKVVKVQEKDVKQLARQRIKMRRQNQPVSQNSFCSNNNISLYDY